MEQRFKEALNNISGIDARSHTILATSGGIDSVVMAYLYQQANLSFSFAHCNFQLRGQESVQDEEFVIKLADKSGAKILVKRFATENYAAENGISIQMAARDLRYQWFKELASEFEANIAIAHHANDVAETMLFNLAKGTGIAGLHGISAYDGFIIRPLIWAKKEEIIDFARKNQIDWREDKSNESEKYMRNIIRRKVIPEMERVNPAFISTNMRNARRIGEAEKFIRYHIEQSGLTEERNGHIYINKEALINLPGSEAVLYELISAYGFSYEQVIIIEKSYTRAGAVFISEDWILNIDRDHLIISKHEYKLTEQIVGIADKSLDFEGFKLQTEVFEAEGYEIIADNNVAAIDLDKLTFPLMIRNWQQGDFFSPLGMLGKKKVSDLLIDEKVPVNMKRNILVMLSGDDIVWVVGHRINNNYKITAETRQVYEVKKVTK